MVEFRAYAKRFEEENRPSFVFISLLHPFIFLRWHRFSLSSIRAKISSYSLIITAIVGFSLLARGRISRVQFEGAKRIVLLPSLYPFSFILLSFFDGNRFSLSFIRAKISSYSLIITVIFGFSFLARGRISRVLFEEENRPSSVFIFLLHPFILLRWQRSYLLLEQRFLIL